MVTGGIGWWLGGGRTGIPKVGWNETTTRANCIVLSSS